MNTSESQKFQFYLLDFHTTDFIFKATLYSYFFRLVLIFLLECKGALSLLFAALFL